MCLKINHVWNLQKVEVKHGVKQNEIDFSYYSKNMLSCQSKPTNKISIIYFKMFFPLDFAVKCDLDTQARIFVMDRYHTIFTCQTGRCLTQGHTSLRAEEFCDTLYVCPFHHLFNIFDFLAVGTVKPLATFLQHSEKDNK